MSRSKRSTDSLRTQPVRRLRIVTTTVLVLALALAGVYVHTDSPLAQAAAATSSAAAWAPGGNSPEFGNGTTTSSSVPVPVSMPAGVTFTAISAGDSEDGSHSVALDSRGHVWTWGVNSEGELGNGTTTSSSVPVPVSMPAGVTFTAISAGELSSLALDSAGRAWAWGDNSIGELGDGTDTGPQRCGAGSGHACSLVPVPVSMPAGVTFTAISGNAAAHSVALDSSGHVWVWGDCLDGELGNGTACQTDSSTPVEVCALGQSSPCRSFLSSITAIAVGDSYTLALDSTGQAWAWGLNPNGALGDGTTTGPQTCTSFAFPCSTTPVPVSMPPRVTFTAISASLALDSTGQAWAWGDNSFGELGNGTTTSSSVPVPVSMPAGVTFTAISAGALYSLALDSTAVDTAAYGERRDYLYELPGGGGETIWLIENELGSWTVMFSSDY